MTNIHDKDELSLSDIYAALRKESRFIMAFTASFGILGLALAFALPVKYQASTAFQMALVANQPVEAPNTLLEKLRQPLFYSSSTLKACGLQHINDSGEDLVKALKPTLSKTAPIIAISYKAPSANEAKACLNNVMQDIQSQQEEIARPLIEALHSQLRTAQDKLAIAERLKNKLAGQSFHFDFNDSKFSASALMLSTMLTKETETKELYNQINDLTIKLAEPQTKKASTLTEIYAPTEKSDPPRALIAIGAIGGGFFLGLIWALVKQNLSQQSKQ